MLPTWRQQGTSEDFSQNDLVLYRVKGERSHTLRWYKLLFSSLAHVTLLRSDGLSPPASSVHGISQGRILEWVAISFSRGSSWPRDWTHISFIGKQILYHWATRETHKGSASFINKDSCKWYRTPETFILPTSHGWDEQPGEALQEKIQDLGSWIRGLDLGYKASVG